MAKDEKKKVDIPNIEIEYTPRFGSNVDTSRPARKGPQEEEFVPPDGGWGWVVCITSLLTNGTAFSILNTFGIIYVYLIKEYAHGDPDISFKTCKYEQFFCFGFLKVVSKGKITKVHVHNYVNSYK